MQFIRTNINKTYRNGELNVSNVAVTNVGGGGGSSSLSGNFLPAVNNGDGSYTVDLSKVVFTGNLIGEGEITAYGKVLQVVEALLQVQLLFMMVWIL